MANSFKSDDSFLRKLAVGAAGTNATIQFLRNAGFNPIELERGSTGFKIWKKIKIKRVRVPDVLCLNTGMRFESRGKTKLEISMSHSLNDPRRAWDNGMRDDDTVSIVLFNQSEESPLDLTQTSPIHFVSVRDLREAYAARRVKTTQPKGVEEGSEIRVVWPCGIADVPSQVSALNDTALILAPLAGGRGQRVQLRRRPNVVLEPQVLLGDNVEANQIVASVVRTATTLQLPATVGEEYFVERLSSASLSERYAAAKALRYRGYTRATTALRARMNDRDEDLYVQLEAAAALAVHDHRDGWEFIESKLRAPAMDVPLEAQLEAVIVISEIPMSRSEGLLIEVLHGANRHEELRAGAAWALGQFATPTSASALVSTFNANPIEIKIEAARALRRIAEPQIPYVVQLLERAEPSQRDGISWAVARVGKFDPVPVVAGADDNLRQWMSYILGYGKTNFDDTAIESVRNTDPQVYFAASVLWQILDSWVADLKEY